MHARHCTTHACIYVRPHRFLKAHHITSRDQSTRRSLTDAVFQTKPNADRGNAGTQVTLSDEIIFFDDVAGNEEAKVELMEVVDFFRRPGKFKSSGARAPKGVLLVGPPGNGKTLMARAVAGESGVAFISSSASEFIEMYMGLGAARVRDLFNTARK